MVSAEGEQYFFGVQAIEDHVVQMFYNVYSSDPQNADSLMKVTRSHDNHVMEVPIYLFLTGVEDLGNAAVFQ
jgi:hypothetical protein